MSKAILVINTGGTFGMVPGPRGLMPGTDLQQRVQHALPELGKGQLDWIDLDPLIDSSDLIASDWARIAQPICAQAEAYQGFLIIHGTDTLAYTSAALSFLFRAFSKPIVITGAQYPLGQPGSDAAHNFWDAYSYLQENNTPGVHVCFGGKLLLGSRVRKIDAQDFAAFDTPNLKGYLSFEADGRSDSAPLIPEFHPAAVGLLYVYPGISGAQLDQLCHQPGLRAVILLTFGSGNIPGFSSDLDEAVRRAARKGIVLVALTQCLRGKVKLGTYENGSVLAEVGALNGYDLTPEAAYARLHYFFAIGLDESQVRDAWLKPLAAELSP